MVSAAQTAYNRPHFFSGVNLGERDLLTNGKVAAGGVVV